MVLETLKPRQKDNENELRNDFSETFVKLNNIIYKIFKTVRAFSLVDRRV